MEVVKAYKLTRKTVGSGKSLVVVPTPKRYNLIVPALRRINKEKPEKSRHCVLLFEDGALYVFKKDKKFLAPNSGGTFYEFDADPCPAIEGTPLFGKDYVVAVVEQPKPETNVVPPPKMPAKPLVEKA